MKRLPLLLLLALLLAACQIAPPATPTADPVTPPTELAPTVIQPVDETLNWQQALISPDVDEAQEVVDAILAAGDTRFIAVFLELMRANQIGLAEGAGYAANIEALQALSGQTFGGDWAAWVEWYGATDLAPPPGFTGWKGRLLAGIDPRFGEFLRDDAPTRIRVEEIMWGGVIVDGIPALDNADMLPAEQADYLQADEAVFGLEINGDARAYPLRIMDWHEMANDVVGGVPVSIAYCTLCGAAIAYDGRASNGETYDFGSSGFLFRSNKLMYDRQTRTLWNQLTGEPVLGELVASDVELDILPVLLTSWLDWLAEHPDTLVLDQDTGFSRPYDVGSAYGDYFADDDTMFPVWLRDNRLPPKTWVYALRLDDAPKAYAVEALGELGVINDVVGDTPVVLIAADGLVEVDGVSRRAGSVAYTSGAAVRAYARGDETFVPGEDDDTVIDAQGGIWQITETALLAADGREIERVGGHLAYWFGWYSFYPDTELFAPSDQ